MRDFAYKNPDFIKDDFVPELVENHPCYQESVYNAYIVTGKQIGRAHV